MASKKTFKSEMQAGSPAAASYISSAQAEAEGKAEGADRKGKAQPEGVEYKSQRLNLLLKPSIFTGIDKIRTMQRVSFNECVNRALSEYVAAHADLIAKYDDTFKD